MQGLHLTADLRGCDPALPLMTDPAALRQRCVAAVSEAGLGAVAEHFHRFTPAVEGEPSGITGVVLLAESHLAVHTWPERGVVTLDVFVCNLLGDNARAAQGLLDALVQGFAPQRQSRQATRRVIPEAAST